MKDSEKTREQLISELTEFRARCAEADPDQAKEALRQSVKRYERQVRLFDGVASTTPDFVYIFDLKGRFLYANTRLLEVWGMKLPDVIGKTCRELGYEQWHHDMHMRQIAQVIETKRPIKGEVPFKAPLTDLFGVYEYIFTPVIGPDGEVDFIAGTTRDVTERKQMEETLHRSNERYRLLSNTAGRLLASSDPQGLVNELCRQVMEHLDCQTFFNFLVDEQASRLHLNACAGIPDEEVQKIEWLDYGVAVCGCAAQSRERIVAEDIFHTPDIRTDLVKSYGIQAYACHPLMIQSRLIGTLSFGTKTRPSFSPEDLDMMKVVTDQVATAMERMRLFADLKQSRDELELRVEERTRQLQQANEELQAYAARLESLNAELQEFAFVASHDLQEPLRKIQSFSTRLKSKCETSLGEDAYDYLSRMENAASRMSVLLFDLLSYSRVTTQANPFEPIHLSRVAESVASDLEIRLEESRANLVIEELPIIEADESQMRQLLQNLIANALKYRREDEVPVVRVYSRSEDGVCQLIVEDNGIGFDEKYLEKIFKPFQRLHGRSSKYDGTGMGLAICRKIVERHGGSITARSSPGKGSTFMVTLPLKQ